MRNARAVAQANHLRKDMTIAENLLWQALRKRNLKGWRFRRQADVAGFIVDFLCHDPPLAIEIDGPVHDFPGRAARDARKDDALRSFGFVVVRIAERDVHNDFDAVLARIGASAPPPPRAGEGRGRGRLAFQVATPTASFPSTRRSCGSPPTPYPSPAGGGGEVLGVLATALRPNEVRRLRRYAQRRREVGS